MSKRHTSDDYHALATSRGYVWLGEEAPRSHKDKTLWKCPAGHEWVACYSDFSQGRSCRLCSNEIRGIKRRVSADVFPALAAKRGFTWLGNGHPYVMENTRWRCSNGHEWEAAYHHIRNGSGCPYCSGSVPVTAGDYARVATERGFFWVGTLPDNIGSKTRWQCQRGHVWEQSYRNIAHNKSGCPHCADFVNGQRVSKTQKRLHSMIGGELNLPFNQYHIDIAFVKEKIAIEYDCWYWHQGKEHHEQMRDLALIEQGWKVLHIRAGDKLPTPLQLKEALARLRAGETRVVITLPDWRD